MTETVAPGCGAPSPERKGSWLQTYSGVAYWPLDPRADEVRLEDIAHHLSQICRYTGACREFYSVAEHAVHVSYLVPRELALHALHHDDPEFVCNDLARPVKYSVEGYKAVEELNAVAIAEALGLWPLTPEQHVLVKLADNAMLLAEQALLMGPPPQPWSPIWVPEYMLEAARLRLEPRGMRNPRRWDCAKAKSEYLQRHESLGGRECA